MYEMRFILAKRSLFLYFLKANYEIRCRKRFLNCFKVLNSHPTTPSILLLQGEGGGVNKYNHGDQNLCIPPSNLGNLAINILWVAKCWRLYDALPLLCKLRSNVMYLLNLKASLPKMARDRERWGRGKNQYIPDRLESLQNIRSCIATIPA